MQRQSFSLEEAEDWVARAMDDSGEDRKYAILVAGHEEPVGFTALYGLSRETGPELGALIGDEVRRSGVGRRAEALTIARAFDEFGAHRVYGEIPAFNEAAKRTVRSLGWQLRRNPGGPRRARRRALRPRDLGRAPRRVPGRGGGRPRMSRAAARAELIEDRGEAAAASDDFFRSPPLPRRRGRHPHPAHRGGRRRSCWRR